MTMERTVRRGLGIQPAEEVLRSPSIRTWVATALVAMGVVLLCNAAAGRLLEAFPQNDGYAMIKGKWNLMKGLKRPVDVLVLGDSSCSLGVDPRVIEGEIGGTALNLCTIGDMAVVGDYWMLDHYIEKFGAPKTEIIGPGVAFECEHHSGLHINEDHFILEIIDPETLEMKVGGFGAVPASFDTMTRRYSWQVNRALRQRFCHVVVNWKDTDGKAPEKPLKWSFQIDRNSAYLPKN